jgi:hypothetical protein
MIDDSWEVNEFYLEKGISAKKAIEESASLLFASLFPGPVDEGDACGVEDTNENTSENTSEDSSEESSEDIDEEYITQDKDAQDKDAQDKDAQDKNVLHNNTQNNHIQDNPRTEGACLCSILFYDRSDKGTGFLPINFAYIDPEDPEGMLMEGCRSKYTDRFFKKLTDDVLAKILAKEISSELPSKQRKRIGLNCILKENEHEQE